MDSTYSVICVSRETGILESVLGRGMTFFSADRMAASMYDIEREDCYYKAVNEKEGPFTVGMNWPPEWTVPDPPD